MGRGDIKCQLESAPLYNITQIGYKDHTTASN